MGKNYIEVEVVTTEDDFRWERPEISDTEFPVFKPSKKVETETEDTDIYWAVRPSEGRWRVRDKGTEEWQEDKMLHGSQAWLIEGGNSVYVYSKRDIEGLRKLLDAIEGELNA